MKLKMNIISISLEKGFSLVELMVGMAIGLLVTLIVAQTMGLFDSQARATTGTADALTNGNIALFSIARELKQAGFGLMPQGEAGTVDSVWDCTALTLNSSGVSSIIPVDITNGVAGDSNASDIITVRYGGAPFGGAPTLLRDDPTVASAYRRVDSNLGCNDNDIVIIRNGNTCNLTKVKDVSVVNNVGDIQTLQLEDAIGASSNELACLGTWNEVSFRVVDGSLTRNGVPILANVVNIQAQYGIASVSNSNQINQWVEPVGATWANPTPENRKLIKALRVAVVTINQIKEKEAVTEQCSGVNVATPTGLCAWGAVLQGGAITVDSNAPAIDLSGGDAEWDHYHYGVFDTVIPLRNGIWAKETL